MFISFSVLLRKYASAFAAAIVFICSLPAGPAELADNEKRLATLSERAERGDASAQYKLAEIHGDPTSGFYEPVRARELLKRAANASHIGAALTLGYDQPYERRSSLVCGNVVVDVQTTCLGLDVANWQTACTQQKIESRLRGSTSIVASRVVPLKKADSEITLAAQLVCLKNGSQFAAVTYSNFSVCDECEWSDYFDESAKYIGSDPSQFQLLKSKVLAPRTARILRAARIQKSLQITRTPHFE